MLMLGLEAKLSESKIYESATFRPYKDMLLVLQAYST